MSRLVVVSNRVAASKLSRPGSEGGLSVALRAALRQHGGIWFGWSGKVLARDYDQPSVAEVGKTTFATIDLTQRDYDDYYKGFANSTLWPLFHYRLDLAEFSQRTWQGYERVNAHFAHRLQPLLKDTDVVWVHDYHFTLLAERLRNANCRHKMGFFLHIPWPALPVFTALPWHREIVKALCAYDLIGFQTEEDLECFQDYIRREVGGEIGENGVIRVFGRTLRAGAFPIGVDTEIFAKMAEDSEHSNQVERLKKSLIGRDLIIGVDRLDYSKGLINRVEAFEHLLTTYPDNRGNVVFLQINPPSRADVADYVDIRRELEATAGRVKRRICRVRLGTDPLSQQELQPAGPGGLLPQQPRRACHAAARRNEPCGEGIRCRPVGKGSWGPGALPLCGRSAGTRWRAYREPL